jgi:7-keto-8-aminopelargonate synthetase-like enzyme
MTKTTSNKFIDTVDECLTNGVNNGIFQVSIEDESLNGRHITIEGKKVVNFGSCSYLGLEIDERLKQGAIDATIRYGTQYSASRAYSACPLYEEAESLFYKIFENNHAILGATTTLTHVAAIPILVQENDLVILDHQVHGSIQLAVQLSKAKGTQVEMIRHNRMDLLEDLVKENPNKYNKIWYMADGLYSMYGDYPPIDHLKFLLEKYSNFHLYFDDAHGMSWAGKHGNGCVLSKMPLHPKVVLSTSLAKGFGVGGGVLVLPDGELKRKILTCGTSYTFSGPVQPPLLGAIVESAKIHLTDEIYQLQNTLQHKIKLAHQVIEQYGLPAVKPSNSPILYLGLGLPRVGYNMVKKLMSEGYYANIGIFPAVPVKCTGLRLPITNGQTDEDIKGILEAFSHHLPKVLEEENFSVEQLSRSFNEPFEETKKRYSVAKKVTEKPKVTIEHKKSISEIDETVWNNLLGGNGTFDWKGCKFLEDTFTGNEEEENNWNFHYLLIRNREDKIVLATFFSELLIKDDMIADAGISMQIEKERAVNKYYLTSKVVMMGSLISVGDHLYIDKTLPEWKSAMHEMIKFANEIKTACNASAVQLRDFDTHDKEVSDFLIKEGFIKLEMPEMHTLNNPSWTDETEYMQRLSTKARWHFRRNIIDKRHYFNFNILSSASAKSKGDIAEWFRLYQNVKEDSYNINTFILPEKYFKNMIDHPNWEVIELRLSEEFGEQENKLVALCFCYRSDRNQYSIAAVGLDYEYVLTHGSYRQSLYQSVKRANELKCNKLYMGMDASIEKKKFGTDITNKCVYIQANDNFNMELMGTLYSNNHETTRV